MNSAGGALAIEAWRRSEQEGRGDTEKQGGRKSRREVLQKATLVWPLGKGNMSMCRGG